MKIQAIISTGLIAGAVMLSATACDNSRTGGNVRDLTRSPSTSSSETTQPSLTVTPTPKPSQTEIKW